MPPTYTSPFRALLATAYDDGATHGYALGADACVFAFELLGQDVDGELRVFRVALIAAEPAAALAAQAPWALGHSRLMPVTASDSLDRVIAACNAAVVEHSVVTAVDLMAGVLGWWPITDAVRGDAQWLAGLVENVVDRAVAVRLAQVGEFAVYTDDAAVHRGVTALVNDLRDTLASGPFLVRDHLEGYDKIIPHVFMADLWCSILDQPDASARLRDLTAIAGVFERVLQRLATPEAEPSWRDFFENLLWVSWFEEIAEPAYVMAAFVSVSGALVLEQQAQFVRAWRPPPH